MPAFRPLAGIYEPSAVQQLPDGRFLVVEDEKQIPFSLFSIREDGTIASRSSAIRTTRSASSTISKA